MQLARSWGLRRLAGWIGVAVGRGGMGDNKGVGCIEDL